MLKGLSLMLLGAGLTVSTLALMNKKEDEKKVSEQEIKEAIEKTKLRRDNGEISEEGCQELVEALEQLFGGKDEIQIL